MKVYIGSCGMGLGHVTRCSVIAGEFSRRGMDVYFSSYSDGFDYLKRTGFRCFAAVPVSFRTREDGTIDLKLTMTQNGVTISLWKFLKQLVGELVQIGSYGPDVVVSDTRISTLIAGFLFRKPTLLILNQYSVQMPNYDRPVKLWDRFMLFSAQIAWKYASKVLELLWGLGNVIVVPDLKPPFTISRYNLTIPVGFKRKVKMIGPLSPGEKTRSIAGLPNGIHSVTREFRPLVFACVSGPNSDRKHLVNILSGILREVPDEWNLVLSSGDPKGSTVARQVGRLTYYEWMEHDAYEEHFDKAAVIVSRAGHGTIMRAVTKAKPMVLIPPPNHTEQANNARRAEEIGLAVVLDQATLNGDVLTRAVKDSLANNASSAETVRDLAGRDGGVEAIVEIVRELAVSPRF